MSICLHCQEEYYRWKNDKGTMFQLFCSEQCAKIHTEELLTQDWPRDPALKYKVPVGEIACPHCGTVQHGVLSPICSGCDKAYWSIEECDEKNNPYFYDNKEEIMPNKDGMGPDGTGPKKTDKGTPTPRRNGSGGGKQKQGNKSPGMPGGGRGRGNR